MEEKKKEEKSILFIGNGFDLRYGRKTRFSDFIDTRYDLEVKVLESIKNVYSLYVYQFNKHQAPGINKEKLKDDLKIREVNEEKSKIIKEAIIKIEEIDFINKEYLKVSEFLDLEDFINLYVDINFLFTDISGFPHINPFYCEFYEKEFIERIIKNKEKIEDFKTKNIHLNNWIIYFKYLKYSNNVGGVCKDYANWVDIENIIKFNFSSNEHRNLNYETLFKDKKEKFESFREFKLLLSEYLETQNTRNGFQKEDLQDMEKYTTILNFNYTNLYGFENKSKNIHGQNKNGSDIVLGFDESELFVKEGISLDTEAVRYTKVDQLIELYKDNNDLDNIFNIKYDRLGIYGLSMGEADYSYYTTIILNNIDNIKLTVYYINGDINSKNEEEKFNNKYELREAFYHLIKHIEKVSGKQLYHNMVISGRIEFVPKVPLKK